MSPRTLLALLALGLVLGGCAGQAFAPAQIAPRPATAAAPGRPCRTSTGDETWPCPYPAPGEPRARTP